MKKLLAKQMRLRTVEVSLDLISAGHLMLNIPAGLWQSLKRKSALSSKPFPPGSNVVMVMYEMDGQRMSGAVHLEELPADVRTVVEAGELWQDACLTNEQSNRAESSI